VQAPVCAGLGLLHGEACQQEAPSCKQQQQKQKCGVENKALA
jgi:hypothetical protein